MVNSKDAKAVLTEFLGTFLLVLVSSWTFTSKELGQIGWLGIGLANGLVTAAVMWAGITSSGAHFNPIVTVVRAAVRSFPVSKAVLYVMVQLLASVLASLFVMLITPLEFQKKQGTTIGFPTPSVLTSDFQIFIIEFVCSAFYLFMFFSTIVDRRAPSNVFGFAVGGVVLACTLAFGPLTGACVNPVRIFGPHLITGTFGHSWTYWLAMLCGGVFTGFYYDFFLMKDSEVAYEDDDEDFGDTMKNSENLNQVTSLRY